MESGAAVIIPLDDRILFVGSLTEPISPVGFPKLPKTLDPISGTELLVGGRWFGKRRLLGTVCIRRCAGI